MSAVLSSTGTWSGLTDVNRYTGDATVPKQFDDGAVEQLFGQGSLDAFTNIGAGADGYPEVNQFVGLMAAGYEIPPGAAIKRIQAILASLYTGQQIGIRRTYP